jgi:transcription initiation factor TFIID subunit 2
MTIRIHEADGTPYEHVLDIRSPFKRYEVPFNTKYKRVRRNTKRYLARQAAAQAAAEGDAEAAEAMGMIDMGFGLEIWEKEKERENWKVADWTEDDEQVMSGATYEWIRMDADFEWIATIEFTQPDFMWVSQLQRDRDVVAQLEVVHPINSIHCFDSLNSSGGQGVIEDAERHCLEHIYKDCTGDELFLQGALRSRPRTCDGVCHSLV